MSYVYLANGRVGVEILDWLVRKKNKPCGLVVHPSPRAKLRDELVKTAGLRPDDILEGPELQTAAGVEWVSSRNPDWLVSIYFGYILKENVLSIPQRGAVNLHPALLPYNRGAYPNVWSIVDHTPAGVTLHFMDSGVDTGDIISQRSVPIAPVDTGRTLYAKLEEASVALFRDTWPSLLAGSFQRRTQPKGGTFHRKRDVERIDRIDPDQRIRAGDLIDIIRARTFSSHKGAYLDLPDRRLYLKLELTEEMKEGI